MAWFGYLLSSVTCFSGPKHRQRFLCEVRVEGISYAGAGNSTTKKDAQFNACKDFVNYLVRSGDVNASDVPKTITEVAPSELVVKDENGDQKGSMGLAGDMGQDGMGFKNQGQRASVFQVCFFNNKV